jgi:glycosyltransferase involved in cell wall biosynthesis
LKGRQRLKKVLIIAKYFGTRIPGLLKYLPEQGWLPILLSSSAWPEEIPPDVKSIRTSYGESLGFLKKLFGLKSQEEIRNRVREKIVTSSDKSLTDRLLTFCGELINYPDSEKGWRTYAVEAAEELIKQGDIDAIISSSSPVTCHVIAYDLKMEYGIPWVADLRDLWSQNHNYSYSRLRRLFDRRLETRVLSAADALVTVTQPWADKLGKLYGGKKRYAITNGFDPENRELPPIELTDKFTITYTGNIYGGKQDPGKLFSALNSLISEKQVNAEDFQIRLYGPRLKWLDNKITDYHLSDIAKQYGTVPHEIAINKQRESQVLLLLDWDDPEETGWYPLKVFEYFASERPILATGGVSGNALGNLLDETGAGIHAVKAEDIKTALLKLYREYKLEGRTRFNGIQAEINKYSQREMAAKFAGILEHLVSEGN